MSTAVNPLTSPAASDPGASNNSSIITNPANAIANQNTFLQLMISELQNQDPTNPTDGTQFITQLAEFSSVASQTESATDLDSILKLAQQAAPVTPPADPSATPQNNMNANNKASATTGS